MSAAHRGPELPQASWVGRASVAVVRALLYLYPAGFRARNRQDMLALYAEQWEAAAAGSGRLGQGRLFIRTVLSLLRGGPAERFARRRTGPSDRGSRLDVRSALMATIRAPSTSLSAITCIALGTAATSAVLTLFSAVALRPLPFPEADRLVRVWLSDPGTDPRGAMSWPDVEDIRAGLTTLDRLEATARSRVMFLGESGARRVEGEAVTSGYFDLVGVDPFVGRLFLPDEYLEGSEPVLLLAYPTWVTHFGADRDVVGSTVRTGLREYTVVGVLPPDFFGTIEDDVPDIEFWIPAVHDRTRESRTSRVNRYVWTVGRLAAGVDQSAAAQEVEAIGRRIADVHPEERGPTSLLVEPLGENWRAPLRAGNRLLLLTAGLLLAVAAANAAGLLTARSLARRPEMAVRGALGAGRRRLIGQLMTETGLLVLVGTAVGTALSGPVLRAFLRLSPEGVPSYVSVTPDVRAVTLVVAVMVVATAVAGFVPGVLASRVAPWEAMRARGSSQSRRERHVSEWIVGAEVALTTVLVVSAGLLMRGYMELDRLDLGFRTEGLLSMAIFIDQRDVDRDEDLPAFREQLRATLLEHAGVESVGLVSPTVPPGTGGDTRILFDEIADAYRDHGLPVYLHRVDADFLSTMDIPIVAGRDLAPTDLSSAGSVVVVSRSVAALMGGPERALGTLLAEGERSFRVVGVAQDVRYHGPVSRRAQDLDLYVPLSDEPVRVVSMAIATRGEPGDLIAPLSARLRALAPSSPLDWVGPTEDTLARHLDGSRFYMLLLGAFAASALVLMAVGLFATLANLVARQRIEIGIRSALGAERRHVLREVVGRGLLVVGLGGAAGLILSLVAGGAVARGLQGVGPFDGPTLLAAVGVIGAVSLIACYVPAARAARVSPTEALKQI